MEKEYTVIVKNREDLSALESEITTSSGGGPIPNRSVDIANPRPGSRVQTHFMLTDEEAEALRGDHRIRAVEIPPEQREDIKLVLRATQSGEFNRPATSPSSVNWGLRRCIETTNIYQQSTTVEGNYDYALNGAGVDIVIQDSGIKPDHSEWEDADGNSRLVEIDWYAASGLSGTQSPNHYRDTDGHGTHVAGIAAGKTYGFAKGAAIYSQKLEGLEGAGDEGTGITFSDSFDALRLWHNNKTNDRPTVVNMSWGYSAYLFNYNIVSGNYRGTPWTYNSQTSDELWDDYGIMNKNNWSFSAQVISVDAEIEDMIDDGIHICIAAGNDPYKADIPGGSDYDNDMTVQQIGVDPSVSYVRYYHRPSSPYSDRAFNVGNIDSTTFFDGTTYKDRARFSSTRGPAVNIWAPGSSILSSYIDSDEVASLSGTSMASPQVAGVCALYLESMPRLSPEELQSKIFSDSQPVVYETSNNDTDYRTSESILGSPNRFLYNKYGVVNPFTIQTL